MKEYQRLENLCCDILDIVRKQPTVEDIDRRIILVAENVGNKLIAEHVKICPANTNYPHIVEKTAENSVVIKTLKTTPGNNNLKWLKIIIPIIVAIIGAIGVVKVENNESITVDLSEVDTDDGGK